MIRYYKGLYKIRKLGKGKDPTGKSIYRALESFIVGNKDLGFRNVEVGDLIVCPIRICHKKMKEIKYRCRKCGFFHYKNRSKRGLLNIYDRHLKFKEKRGRKRKE